MEGVPEARFSTSPSRNSVLKPPNPRIPLKDLVAAASDEDNTVARKRRVSFANVNKIKEFSAGAESMVVCHTPAYEEPFNSLSSDSSYPSGVDGWTPAKSQPLPCSESVQPIINGKENFPDEKYSCRPSLLQNQFNHQHETFDPHSSQVNIVKESTQVAEITHLIERPSLANSQLSGLYMQTNNTEYASSSDSPLGEMDFTRCVDARQQTVRRSSNFSSPMDLTSVERSLRNLDSSGEGMDLTKPVMSHQALYDHQSQYVNMTRASSINNSTLELTDTENHCNLLAIPTTNLANNTDNTRYSVSGMDLTQAALSSSRRKSTRYSVCNMDLTTAIDVNNVNSTDISEPRAVGTSTRCSVNEMDLTEGTGLSNKNYTRYSTNNMDTTGVVENQLDYSVDSDASMELTKPIYNICAFEKESIIPCTNMEITGIVGRIENKSTYSSTDIDGLEGSDKSIKSYCKSPESTEPHSNADNSLMLSLTDPKGKDNLANSVENQVNDRTNITLEDGNPRLSVQNVDLFDPVLCKKLNKNTIQEIYVSADSLENEKSDTLTLKSDNVSNCGMGITTAVPDTVNFEMNKPAAVSDISEIVDIGTHLKKNKEALHCMIPGHTFITSSHEPTTAYGVKEVVLEKQTADIKNKNVDSSLLVHLNPNIKKRSTSPKIESHIDCSESKLDISAKNLVLNLKKSYQNENGVSLEEQTLQDEKGYPELSEPLNMQTGIEKQSNIDNMNVSAVENDNGLKMQTNNMGNKIINSGSYTNPFNMVDSMCKTNNNSEKIANNKDNVESSRFENICQQINKSALNECEKEESISEMHNLVSDGQSSCFQIQTAHIIQSPINDTLCEKNITMTRGSSRRYVKAPCDSSLEYMRDENLMLTHIDLESSELEVIPLTQRVAMMADSMDCSDIAHNRTNDAVQVPIKSQKGGKRSFEIALEHENDTEESPVKQLCLSNPNHQADYDLLSNITAPSLLMDTISVPNQTAPGLVSNCSINITVNSPVKNQPNVEFNVSSKGVSDKESRNKSAHLVNKDMDHTFANSFSLRVDISTENSIIDTFENESVVDEVRDQKSASKPKDDSLTQKDTEHNVTHTSEFENIVNDESFLLENCFSLCPIPNNTLKAPNVTRKKIILEESLLNIGDKPTAVVRNMGYTLPDTEKTSAVQVNQTCLFESHLKKDLKDLGGGKFVCNLIPKWIDLQFSVEACGNITNKVFNIVCSERDRNVGEYLLHQVKTSSALFQQTSDLSLLLEDPTYVFLSKLVKNLSLICKYHNGKLKENKLSIDVVSCKKQFWTIVEINIKYPQNLSATDVNVSSQVIGNLKLSQIRELFDSIERSEHQLLTFATALTKLQY